MRQDVSLSTTLYSVTVSRYHQFYLVTSFTWSNLRRLTFAFVFRWRFYPRLIYVLSRCNVRYNDTFPRDVKQIGFYPKQTLTTVFQLLFRFSPLCLWCHLVSLVSFRLMCIFRLSFDILFPCSMAGNFGTHPQPPLLLFLLWNRFRHFFSGGGFSSPFSSQPKRLRLFFYEGTWFDRCCYASFNWQKWHFSTFAVKKRGALCCWCFPLDAVACTNLFNRTRSVLGFKMEQKSIIRGGGSANMANLIGKRTITCQILRPNYVFLDKPK